VAAYNRANAQSDLSSEATKDMGMAERPGDPTLPLVVTWEESTAPPPLAITAVSRPYPQGTLANGQLIYDDRTYTITNTGGLNGASYLRTRNADKQGAANPWLTFTVNRPVTVYVGYDTRHPIPSWLASWTNTSTSLVTSDATLRLYRRDFPVGQVAIGPNGLSSSAGSMYSVVVIER
jgi:hypothetical protein